MPLPALTDWNSTRTSLHQAAQVVGAVRKASVPPLPNYAHLGLFVTPQGLTTGLLPAGDSFELSFENGEIWHMTYRTIAVEFPLEGSTQTSLTEAVSNYIDDFDSSRGQLDRTKLTASEKLSVNLELAADYARALYTIYTAVARFRARLLGGMSPLIVWPHGFDLSFLWFKRGFDEKTDPHLNFGFSPGSPGFDRPYVYAYAHPIPPGLLDVKLPAPARWHTSGWTGVVIDYDRLAADSDVESTLERLLLEIYAALSPLLNQ